MDKNPATLRVLFVCSQNRLRSPTAEKTFGDCASLEVKSAGVAKDATVPINLEMLEWADVVFVMERKHRNEIHKRFKDIYLKKRIICLYIPDLYEYMDVDLIDRLKQTVAPHLVRLGCPIDLPK
jgi:predicted protein tyrosine phosphatase